MNLNYVGSVAERFMKFRSTLAVSEGVAPNLFNAISIYIPKSLAAKQFNSDAYTAASVTAETYAVIAVTVDNYKDVLADGSNLLSQWLPVFNDGTNSAVMLICIVFDDTDFVATVTDKAVTWAPLTKAFNELYFVSFFKTLFSEHYDGSKNEEGEPNTHYDDSNYFDMALALSYQCEVESTLSMCLLEIKVVVPEKIASDANKCKVLSYDRGKETAKCTTLTATDLATRAEYFWGYLNLIGGTHTEVHVHNGVFMLPIILGKWFEAKNSSGQFIGNKLAKIRLSKNGVKPTGLPSPLNSDVNLNLAKDIYTILDSKNVGYFISIANDSDSDVELVSDRSISGMPVTAYNISKWIDYTTAQDVAKYRDSADTLTKPVLCNQQTYTDIQGMLIGNIQKFSGTGRVESVTVNFPPFSEAKVGNSLQGTAVWNGKYIDDLESVDISGSITF